MNFSINNPGIQWIGDTSVCLVFNFNGGYFYYQDTDPPSYYSRTVKIYANGSTVYQRVFGDGQSNEYTFYKVTGLSNGTNYTFSSEVYGNSGESSQSVNWNTSVTVGDTGASKYYKNLFSNPAANDSEQGC